MSGEPQWTFYEDITDTLSRDFLEGEDLQLQVHQAKWNGRLLSFELRNFSKNEVEVKFKKREPTMIYINRRDSENRYSRRVAAGESEPFMFNLDWDPLQETIKDWATQVELFPHVDLYFHWKDAQDKTIFMKYRCLRFDLKEWNETRLPTRDSSNRHWIPSFTKQRPLLGGRDLMRPLLCDNDEVQQFGDFQVQGIKFDGTLLYFVLKNVTKEKMTASFSRWKPAKAGLRFIYPDRDNRDYIDRKPFFTLDSGQTTEIGITFRNPRCLKKLDEWKNMLSQQIPYVLIEIKSNTNAFNFYVTFNFTKSTSMPSFATEETFTGSFRTTTTQLAVPDSKSREYTWIPPHLRASARGSGASQPF